MIPKRFTFFDLDLKFEFITFFNGTLQYKNTIFSTIIKYSKQAINLCLSSIVYIIFINYRQ